MDACVNHAHEFWSRGRGSRPAGAAKGRLPTPPRQEKKKAFSSASLSTVYKRPPRCHHRVRLAAHVRTHTSLKPATAGRFKHTAPTPPPPPFDPHARAMERTREKDGRVGQTCKQKKTGEKKTRCAPRKVRRFRNKNLFFFRGTYMMLGKTLAKFLPLPLKCESHVWDVVFPSFVVFSCRKKVPFLLLFPPSALSKRATSSAAHRAVFRVAALARWRSARLSLVCWAFFFVE